MILLIDNYDSFSYNLYQLIGSLRPDIRVVRNDELTVEEVDALAPDAIILSPGPGKPEDAGICIQVVQRLGGKYPILGVCLGHQSICVAYGGVVSYASTLMHGKSSDTALTTADPLFRDCTPVTAVGRYHSLAAKEESLPDVLQVIARTVDTNDIMAVRHRDHLVYGLQFHPESVLTPEGGRMLQNFLQIVENRGTIRTK